MEDPDALQLWPSPLDGGQQPIPALAGEDSRMGVEKEVVRPSMRYLE
jgi:hypothetical protein